MKAELRKRIVEYLIEKYHPENEDFSEDIIIWEYLHEMSPIHKEKVGEHRWWNDINRVVRLGDLLVQIESAETTNDDSLSDIGWKGDYSNIIEVEPYEKTITAYRPIA